MSQWRALPGEEGLYTRIGLLPWGIALATREGEREAWTYRALAPSAPIRWFPDPEGDEPETATAEAICLRVFPPEVVQTNALAEWRYAKLSPGETSAEIQIPRWHLPNSHILRRRKPGHNAFSAAELLDAQEGGLSTPAEAASALAWEYLHKLRSAASQRSRVRLAKGGARVEFARLRLHTFRPEEEEEPPKRKRYVKRLDDDPFNDDLDNLTWAFR